jgi:hypothetical protein
LLTHCRQALVWLLCALLVAAGAPARAGSPCAAAAAGDTSNSRSCCAPGQCHCGDMQAAQDRSDCCGDRDQRVPATPAPRQEAAPTIDLAPRPVGVATADESAAQPTLTSQRATNVMLPARTRQEVLSVWRL